MDLSDLHMPEARPWGVIGIKSSPHPMWLRVHFLKCVLTHATTRILRHPAKLLFTVQVEGLYFAKKGQTVSYQPVVDDLFYQTCIICKHYTNKKLMNFYLYFPVFQMCQMALSSKNHWRIKSL